MQDISVGYFRNYPARSSDYITLFKTTGWIMLSQYQEKEIAVKGRHAVAQNAMETNSMKVKGATCTYFSASNTTFGVN
jgi:hypothetical protein